MSNFVMKRLGVMMEPEPGNPHEAMGVLNPAAIRGRDGKLYLFPRLVAAGNFSRIGIARVNFNDSGDPIGVDRLGIALEPSEEYELGANGIGGCEDARVTFVEPLGHFVMTYTALSDHGPRIALAISDDLFKWQKLGLATFRPHGEINFEGVDDKDAGMFPVAVPDPAGHSSLAILHRPLFTGTRPEDKAVKPKSHIIDLDKESIWISYHRMEVKGRDAHDVCHFTSHRRLAAPVEAWEKLKIGAGTPPILTRHGWLVVYHGVSDISEAGSTTPHLSYSAGILVLSTDDLDRIRYRSAEPVLVPQLPEELLGTIARVVFPTGIDRRDDLGTPDRLDVYYGMADDRIGVARLDVPDRLPESKPTPLSDAMAPSTR